MSENKFIEAGKLFTLESGEYSDYGVDGLFVALQRFSPLDEAQDYLCEMKGGRCPLTSHSFFARLAKKGLVMRLDYHAVWTGGSGDIAEIEFDDEYFDLGGSK